VRKIIPVPLFFFVVFFVTCSSDKKPSLKIFRYNEAAGITSLDPAFARTTENIWAVNQLFNGLVQLDSSLNIQPCLAYRWELSDSGKTYTFHLRKDVWFHRDTCFGGVSRKVVASDLVYSLGRIKNPATGSPGSWILSAVAENGIRALNDSTVQLKLSHSYYPFLNLLTHVYCSVVPKEAVEYYGDRFRAHPVGTGPFVFKAWAEGEKLVFRRNPLYFEKLHGKQLPFIDGVSVSFIKDRQTGYLQFLKGAFDFMSGVDGSYKDDLLDADGNLQTRHQGIRQHRMPYLKTDYLGLLASAHPALANLNFKKALSAAIDRRELIRALRNGLGSPAERSFVPASLMPRKISEVKHPEKSASEWLQASGVTVSPDRPIVISTTAAYADVCEYIQQRWNALGIPCKVDVLLPAVHSKSIADGALMCFRKSWVADYADAENFFSVFYSGNIPPAGPNYTHYSNALFDRYYNEYNTLANANRRDLALKMDSLVANDIPVIPIYTDEAVVFYHHRVKGLHPNAMNVLQVKTVEISE